MTTSSAALFTPRAHVALARDLRATESAGAFHARVLDGIKKVLETHTIVGKTGAREFYEFEKARHERLLDSEREIVGGVMSASDIDAEAIPILRRTHWLRWPCDSVSSRGSGRRARRRTPRGWSGR